MSVMTHIISLERSWLAQLDHSSHEFSTSGDLRMRIDHLVGRALLHLVRAENYSGTGDPEDAYYAAVNVGIALTCHESLGSLLKGEAIPLLTPEHEALLMAFNLTHAGQHEQDSQALDN
ncbi:MAG: hypothetical protein AAFV53_19910 [Myxococcota bacterium]